eukprot:4835370-Lingulodinium_polyedra.AAC.1
MGAFPRSPVAAAAAAVAAVVAPSTIGSSCRDACAPEPSTFRASLIGTHLLSTTTSNSSSSSSQSPSSLALLMAITNAFACPPEM